MMMKQADKWQVAVVKTHWCKLLVIWVIWPFKL